MSKSYYEIKNPYLKSILLKMTRRIRKMLPDHLQFTLFIFSDDPKSMFYASSIERDSGLSVIKEWVMKEEQKQRGGFN